MWSVRAGRRHGQQKEPGQALVRSVDAYLCPADEWLTYHYTNEEDGKTLRNYWTNVCGQCPVKAKCTTGKERRVKRWEHEANLDRVQKRPDDD